MVILEHLQRLPFKWHLELEYFSLSFTHPHPYHHRHHHHHNFLSFLIPLRSHFSTWPQSHASSTHWSYISTVDWWVRFFLSPLPSVLASYFFHWLWENKNENGNELRLACVLCLFLLFEKKMILFGPFFLTPFLIKVEIIISLSVGEGFLL